MDFKKSGLCRVELLVARLKVVRLIGGFKEGADLRSCSLFNKFGNKTEVGHGAIILKIFFAETGLLKQWGDIHVQLGSGREGHHCRDACMNRVGRPPGASSQLHRLEHIWHSCVSHQL